MLKYASKLVRDIFLSVLATVIGSYLAHDYIAGLFTAKAPVSVAHATVDPKRADANAASRETVQAEVTASERSSDVVSAIGPVSAVSGRFPARLL